MTEATGQGDENMSSTTCELIASDRHHHYWFRWCRRPESGLIGWTLTVDLLDKPIRTGGYRTKVLGGAWDAATVEEAHDTAALHVNAHQNSLAGAS